MQKVSEGYSIYLCNAMYFFLSVSALGQLSICAIWATLWSINIPFLSFGVWPRTFCLWLRGFPFIFSLVSSPYIANFVNWFGLVRYGMTIADCQAHFWKIKNNSWISEVFPSVLHWCLKAYIASGTGDFINLYGLDMYGMTPLVVSRGIWGK